ncbi:MAG TPA: metallophosphoesterase [Tepidisphaeraceae bacterium]
MNEGVVNAGATEGAAQRAAGANWRAELVRPRVGPTLHFWSVEGFEFNHLTLWLNDLPPELAGVRILHLTDLHLRSKWPRGLDPLIERVVAKPPHLILYGGDQAHNMHHLEPSFPHIERLIHALRPTHGSFAILGNHDGDLLAPKLREWGVPMIGHQMIEVSINGRPIEIIGYAGPDRADIQVEKNRTYPQRRALVPRVVLSHYPDAIRIADKLKPDLYLAGHTHGGQICLPGGVPLLKHDSLPRKLCRGLHNYKEICLFVSRGMGFSSPLQMRLFCPSEAVEITLERPAVESSSG